MTITATATSPVVFRELDHTYWLGERELLGVTSILKRAGLVNDAFYTEEAALRGTYVHAASVLEDEGALDFDALDPVLKPYVAAYRQFLTDVQPVWTLSEAIVHDDVLGYAGRLDRVGRWGALPSYYRAAVIDLKTGSIPPHAGPQTAAYARCLPGLYQRFALELHDTGTYKLEPLTDRRDTDTFLAALHLQQWRAARGLR